MNPQHLIDSLASSGWEVAGRREGVYVRLAWPNTPNRSLLVPLDESAPEHGGLLNAAVTQLEDAARVGQDAATALADADIKHPNT